MESGRLRHLVTIQEPVYSQDDYGKKTMSWREFGMAYAKITPASGDEIAIGGHYSAQLTHNVMIRYIKGLKEKMRLTIDGMTLEIMEIKFDATMRRNLLLKCNEKKV